MQAQLDEIARGLIVTFAETDPNPDAAPALADKVGLFTWKDNTIPGSDNVTLGLAASIKVNDAVVSDPRKLRDGGINGDDYVSNPVVPPATEPSAAYTALLDRYMVKLDEPLKFATSAAVDPVTGSTNPSTALTGTSTLTGYASSSIGWLEQLRKAATAANDNKSAMLSKTQQALSNSTGVSLDEELALMLDLEQSYKASAKLLSAVDEMLKTLLDTVR